MLLFSLAGRLGLLTCFRCGRPVEDVGDLSIDHKVSWQGNEDPSATFFDMENIAFSHSKCNSGASGETRRKYDRHLTPAEKMRIWRKNKKLGVT